MVALAQDEAIRFGHDYIGTEHLLLGLVREGEGVAAQALTSLGVELSKVRTAVEFIIGKKEHAVSPSEITLSPRTKRVIELAIDEAKKLGHPHVGTEHLLLGLVREGEGIASGVLESLGVSLEKVRHQVIAILGAQGPGRTASQWTRVESYAPLSAISADLDANVPRRDWYCEDVLTHRLRVEVLYEDERVLGFVHPYPVYDRHGVVIPKTHVLSLLSAQALDGELLSSMVRGVQAVAKALAFEDSGFQLVSNAGAVSVTPRCGQTCVGAMNKRYRSVRYAMLAWGKSRFKHRCARTVAVMVERLERDDVTALVNGGSNDIGNTIASCRGSNCRKGRNGCEVFESRLRTEP